MATTAAAIDARPLATDLFLYAGDSLNLNIAVTDNAGAAMNLNGYTAEAQIRATADAPTAVDFATDIVDSAIELALTPAETAALPGKGVWDVQIISATGDVTTLTGGKVTVSPEVTR